MQINLRKANAIQSEIRRAINETGNVPSTVSVSEYTKDVSVEVQKATVEWQLALQRKVALTNALYAIRTAVAAANANHNVNDLLTEVARTEAVMAINSQVANMEVARSLDEIQGRIQKLKEAPVDSPRAALYGERYNQVATSVVTEADVANAKEAVKTLKRQRQDLQDKLLGLNVTTQINLSDETVAVLKGEGIL